MPSREELIAELTRLHEASGRTPTQALMAGQGKYDPEQYLTEFDSWDDALKAAGFDPENLDAERYHALAELDGDHRRKIRMLLESNDKKQFFSGQLLAEIGRLAVELGEPPSIRDMHNYGRYSDNNYYKYFEGWRAAVEELGLTSKKRPDKISNLELLSELRRVGESVDGFPTTQDIREDGKYSVPTYYSRFDSWKDACEEAGLKSSNEN